MFVVHINVWVQVLMFKHAEDTEGHVSLSLILYLIDLRQGLSLNHRLTSSAGLDGR